MDIPMVFSDNEMPTLDQLARCATVSNVLLAFNEPEYTSQANMTPAEGAAALHYLESAWPGEMYCCGNLVSSAGWFDRMMTIYKANYGEVPRLVGVHIHVYVGGGLPGIENPDDSRWLERSQANYKTYLATLRRWGVPERVIVSECCLLGKFDDATYLKAQDQYMAWLRSETAVESVAWFSARYAGFPNANLLRPGGGLTTVGENWLEWRWK